jgi:hypothetical protein
MRYRIFPPIGLARLGEDRNYFLGPETPGGGPGELQPDGSTTPVKKFKDASGKMIRKQGARFHIFESEDGTAWRPANLPAGATVKWTVTLENKKAAVERGGEPPTKVARPKVVDDSMVIRGGTKSVAGNDITGDFLKGVYRTTDSAGQKFEVEVELGQLRTDGQGRLIVLGGRGHSSAPPNTPLATQGNTYFKNPKWHDDVADGPVTAEVQLAPGAAPVAAEGGAWVVVAPPDYAPEIECVVSLYDVLRQVGISKNELPEPGRPSFDLDIAPILTRVRRLQWVHNNSAWKDARLASPKLRETNPADPFRKNVLDQIVLKVQSVFKGHTNAAGPPYRLRAFQRKQLDEWAAGNFDPTPAQHPPGLTADGLTRAALEATAGQGFCPGIEAGLLLLDGTIYAKPFDYRIDHAQLKAGDLTALMAQPWQADFLKCHTEWWPMQRPDLAPQASGPAKSWPRGATTHRLMLENSPRLGFIVRQQGSEVFFESERDPTL